jgi:FAD/FMN-containing dehydrogenase
VPGINRLSARVWGDRSFSDASHRVFATSRGVRFREMEYAVPVEKLADAFRGIQRVIADHDWRIEFPIEVRTAAADDLWLSTASGRERVHRRAPLLENRPDGVFRRRRGGHARPRRAPALGQDAHAGCRGLRERYPRFDDFTALRDRLDPDRLFRNPYLTGSWVSNA